ncbi:putative phage abortive infection protein [Lysinibacillus xylanilyticus]|uniref:Phage abortive infection protein n=1 Tax=Lysinibacillus xylanilyticus TaxID=582475 RepID=A0ABV3VQ95_9BACI
MDYFLFACLIVINLTFIISFIVYGFENPKKEVKKKIITIENVLILIGIFVIICASFLPFLILGHFNLDLKYIELKDFGDLGPVGDYMGGTTVGLLSLASLMFVAAAMMMQKKELELQRKEVERLNNEFEISNSTMKQQQFESAFFNMVNLHHTILQNMKIDNISDKELMKELYLKLKKNGEKYDELEIILIYFLSLEEKKKFWISIIEDNFQQEVNELEKSTVYPSDSLLQDISNYRNNIFDFLTNEFQELFEKFQVDKRQVASISADAKYINRVLKGYEELLLVKIRAKYTDFTFVIDTALDKYKKEIYEKFYDENEYLIGHYFRNFYHTIKFINTSNLINDVNRKQYQSILKAQLSSYEILMIFYNAFYSSQGEKLKTQISDIDFFDKHLYSLDIIWENDIRMNLNIL